VLDIATGHRTLSVNSVVAQVAWFPPHTFTENHDTSPAEGGAFHLLTEGDRQLTKTEVA
jgi:hypothetical protein